MNLAHAPAQINPSNVFSFPALTIPAVQAIRDSLRRLDAFQKAVLYALASRLPNAWPSVETIAHDSGASRPKVKRVLASLERDGMVRRTRRDGRYGTYSYELDLQAIRGGVEGAPPGRQGALGDTPQGVPVDPLRGKGKSQWKRADAAPEETAQMGVGEVIQPAPAQTDPTLAPNSGEGDRVVGVRPPEPPPMSGRYELPDVSTPEPATVDLEVRAMNRRCERGEAIVSEPAHLVAAFDAAHESVYGFASPELRGSKTWKCAVSAAVRTLTETFGGDLAEAERYVVWAWTRERAARKAGRERDRPIGWRLVFGPMVADYLKSRADRRRAA
jgi:hypothetical protein